VAVADPELSPTLMGMLGAADPPEMLGELDRVTTAEPDDPAESTRVTVKLFEPDQFWTVLPIIEQDLLVGLGTEKLRPVGNGLEELEFMLHVKGETTTAEESMVTEPW
jgi:hypothetical protein